MKTIACVGCGCTQERACVTAAGTCSWVSLDPPLCSACADGAEVDVPEATVECEASKSGFHQPLFVDATSAYCIHCRAPLRVSEAA